MSNLVERARELCQPLSPIPTGVTAQLPKLNDIRAVLFDVYGTMLISGSGDVGTATADNNAASLEEALHCSGFEVHTGTSGVRGIELLDQQIRAFHKERRSDGVAYPEVEIRSIWKSVVAELCDGQSGDIERMAIEYECRVNPVWPMPDLVETLDAIKARGIMLGIVSNAQFYTPVLLETLLGQSHIAAGFRESACVWSYEMLEAKPSRHLYEFALKDLNPSQVLYVGNDMRNDIWPSQELGCQTALFAGDKRSLRLREDDDCVANVKPGSVITNLGQIIEII